ncbi:MAG TPA: hypothetical protein VFY15_02515 [Acidimicrobiia bacterium]|nr:hypothetical protein [Acidimicrobiia bacterium]
MYELADWGRPAPAEWNEPRERLDLRLPPSLVRVLRARARSENVNVSIVVERMLREAMHLVPAGRGYPD